MCPSRNGPRFSNTSGMYSYERRYREGGDEKRGFDDRAKDRRVLHIVGVVNATEGRLEERGAIDLVVMATVETRFRNLLKDITIVNPGDCNILILFKEVVSDDGSSGLW
eukprot:CAMPEP_0172537892 /NCGR_PEP_ID=MMETSP1067-20121228/9409_1 /TAXON_ID=265564 ORGANISM="Thalassiosira punctigera, Strain Tpunct2005C2" /NCGR_SAMPLE_ID=MMETSP1067 /ASSEMBLY_ACC=CAM_ASM_000444 /LENGTH=108 /DNA_ID=CAMNT_0013323289 /DNA_START=316 /DNA_END=639 /DNA_ORIENTATION=-